MPKRCDDLKFIEDHLRTIRLLHKRFKKAASAHTVAVMYRAGMHYRTLLVKRRCITEGAMVILGHFFGQKYLEGAFTSEGAPNRQKERRKKKNSEAPNS